TTRRLRWLTPARVAGLFLIPTTASLIVLTGDTAGLVHTVHALDPAGLSPFIRFTRGPGAYVMAAYASLLLAGDIVLFLVSARGASRVARRQALLFTIGLFCPVMASITVLFHPRGLAAFDPGALGVAVAGILAATAFFRYRLLDLLPIVNTVLFDAIDDIALVFDVKGGLVGFNGRAEIELGLSRRTSPGISRLPAPWDVALGPNGDLASRRSEVILQESGRSFDVAVTELRLPEGGALGTLVVLHETTRRRRTEEELRYAKERLQTALESSKNAEAQLRQAQKMEAIGRLAGGVAHDFNNILTIIAGYSELLRDGQPAGSPVLESVDAITRAAGRASTLTRQLLAFSRKQVMETRVFCAGDLLRNVEAMLARVIGEDVNLSILAPAGLWAVRADPGQVEQVLMNLVVNARDAMPNGGTLVIATSNAALDAEFVAAHPMVTPGDYVRIDVTDTGHGMDANTMARLFEPFFTTKAPGKGTGLGLSMAYGIVKQSGGHIFCESAVGKGTTFTMYFPRVEEEPDAIAPTAPTAPRGKGSGNVLLVEDEAGVRGFVRTVLERGGYHVEEAADGLEALDLCTRGGATFSHLVTDVVMPRMSGPDLVARVRELTPTIRVLYMSGYSERTILHGDSGDGSVAFLPKPFNPGELLSKLREMKSAPNREK
ncbi:MAG TPA: histidine kinase N-terminal 7TM domain-containing protein, partial [Spirochaetia bacterium]